MTTEKLLLVYLHPPILQTAQAGKLGFLNRIEALLRPRGWQVRIEHSGDNARAKAPERPGYALFNMEKPTHDRALTFRLAYHYPFWRLEPLAERWRWPVALAQFDGSQIEHAPSRDFARKLRDRVLPGPDPVRGDHVLIPLQGHIRRQRSFQAASPLRMVRDVAETGQSCIATLHPKEIYDDKDRAALDAIACAHPNLTIGGDTKTLLRDCAFVVTQNSGVGFDGLIMDKPVVLYGLSDFHHIALNVTQMGSEKALARAPDHKPPTAKYLDWFLRRTSLDMMAPDADDRLLAAMKKGGWPV